MEKQTKESVQSNRNFQMYPEDFEELKRLKEKSELPWSSFFKLLIAEHKDINK